MRSLVLGLLSMISCAGCGAIGAAQGGDPWAGGATQLLGLAGFDNGLAAVTIDLQAPYAGPTSMGGTVESATAQLTSATSASAMLTGSFDPSTHALTLSGGGYSVNANADSSGMNGFANGPTSPGAFAAQPKSPTLLCGTFTGSLSGLIGLVFEPTGQATAVYVVSGAQTRGTVGGKVSGGRLDFASPITFNGHNLMIGGSVGPTSGQGTWSDTSTTNGNWTAGACP